MSNKKFDCVEMKHKSAREINKRLIKLTRAEELDYWRQKSVGLHSQQPRVRKKLKKV